MHYLCIYARCTTNEELEAAVDDQLKEHWRALSKTDRQVFELIGNYSAEHLAVQVSHNELEKELALSNTSIRRSIRKLDELNMIDRITYVHPTLKGLGPNIYTILPLGVR